VPERHYHVIRPINKNPRARQPLVDTSDVDLQVLAIAIGNKSFLGILDETAKEEDSFFFFGCHE